MLLRGSQVLSTLKSLQPPFDAETERELIAAAFGDPDDTVRAAATKLVLVHVKNGALLRSTLTPRFHKLREPHACERLRALDRKDRGALAAALVARGADGRGVAFEEDPDFARTLLPGLVVKKDGGTLQLTRHTVGRREESIDLTTIPDVVFDSLPALHKKRPFTHLQIWGAPMTTLPKRFIELAPFLRKLTLYLDEMTALPDVVCTCTKLESLVIYSKKLARLSSKLPKLTRLSQLSLHSGAMTSLPTEVTKLKALKVLDLGSMPLKSLPATIGALSELETLDLYSTRKLRQLPPELARCTHLRHVNLRWSGVPDEAMRALLPKVKIKS